MQRIPESGPVTAYRFPQAAWSLDRGIACRRFLLVYWTVDVRWFQVLALCLNVAAERTVFRLKPDGLAFLSPFLWWAYHHLYDCQSSPNTAWALCECRWRYQRGCSCFIATSRPEQMGIFPVVFQASFVRRKVSSRALLQRNEAIRAKGQCCHPLPTPYTDGHYLQIRIFSRLSHFFMIAYRWTIVYSVRSIFICLLRDQFLFFPFWRDGGVQC